MQPDDGDARYARAFPIAAVVIVIAILAVNGFPHGTDWPYELTRVAEMREAFAAGQLPPFWAPDDYHGFGSPVFLYYAPLFATIASLFTLIVPHVPDASIAALVLSVIAAALMMRGAAAEIAGPVGHRVAVIAFVLHPYVLADIWIRNANAEVTALALLPGVIAGAVSPRPHRRFWWTFLSLTGCVLAHNLTSLVATAMVVSIAIFVHRNVRALLPTLAGVAAALAVTSFFWLPAMALQKLAVRSDALIAGKFDFHNQFPRPTALIVLNPPSEYSSGGYLGAIMVAVVLIAAIAWRGSDSHARRVLQACAIAAAVLILLMLRVSTPVWERLPLIRYLQFPWRLVGPLAVVTILGFAMLLPQAARAWPRTTRIVEALFLGVALVNALPIFLIYPRMPRSEMRRFSALLTPERIRTYGLRTIVGDAYLPVDADPRVMRAGREPVAFLSPGISIRVVAAPPGNAHVAVSSANGGSIAFRRWFFPVWDASIDGTPVPIRKMAGGIAGVAVPPGEHEIRFALAEPVLRTITKAASAMAAAIVAIVVLLRRRRAVSSQA